jgi:hypothetical protein
LKTRDIGIQRCKLLKSKKMTVGINTSSDNNRFTSLDGSRKRKKEKNETVNLGARARMTFVATAEIDDSDKVDVSNEENVTSEQMKDYLADVLKETKKKKKPKEYKK